MGEPATQIAAAGQAGTAELRPDRADDLLPDILGDQRRPLPGDESVPVAARVRIRPQRVPVRAAGPGHIWIGGDEAEIVPHAPSALDRTGVQRGANAGSRLVVLAGNGRVATEDGVVHGVTFVRPLTQQAQASDPGVFVD